MRVFVGGSFNMSFGGGRAPSTSIGPTKTDVATMACAAKKKIRFRV